MFPLNITLIGCQGDLLQLLRLELSVQSARIDAEFGDVESAIAAARGPAGPADDAGNGARRPEPAKPWRRLLIVYVDSIQELPAIKRLSSFFAGNPILVLMKANSDPGVPIQAMRMGANQVVNLPLQADDFKQALDCIANQFGAPAANRVIAVAGVTGGCGATTMAINIAFEISQAHPTLRVVLAELSLQVGKLPLYLNVEPRLTTHDLLKDIHRIDLYFMQQALTPVVEGFSILAGPYHAVAPLSAPPADVLLLVDCLKQLADVVVLDVPCTYDAVYFDTLNSADQVVLVGEQKVPSIRSMQMVHGSLEAKPHVLLMNRYDPELPGFGVDRLKQMLRIDEVETVASDYSAVSSSINQGLPLRLKEPRSHVLADITRLALKLAPVNGAAAAKNNSSVFGGLIRALGIKR
jgi:pilus assembly protein CpaE